MIPRYTGGFPMWVIRRANDGEFEMHIDSYSFGNIQID